MAGAPPKGSSWRAGGRFSSSGLEAVPSGPSLLAGLVRSARGTKTGACNSLVLSQPRNSSWRNGTLDTGKLMMGKRQFNVPSIPGMTEY